MRGMYLDSTLICLKWADCFEGLVIWIVVSTRHIWIFWSFDMINDNPDIFWKLNHHQPVNSNPFDDDTIRRPYDTLYSSSWKLMRVFLLVACLFVLCCVVLFCLVLFVCYSLLLSGHSWSAVRTNPDPHLHQKCCRNNWHHLSRFLIEHCQQEPLGENHREMSQSTAGYLAGGVKNGEGLPWKAFEMVETL